MIVNPAIVGTGDCAQLNAAVVDLERLDLLGAMRAQPILQIDAGERRGQLTQICRGRADETRELAEAPMRRRDWRIGTRQQERKLFGMLASTRMAALSTVRVRLCSIAPCTAANSSDSDRYR
jgi:hypothetical protein